MSAAEPRRRGRPAGTRSGDPATRERILAAARTEFSERGYDKASIRGIAKAAGVDAALVHHYFGPKDQVFEAAVELVFAPALDLPEVVARSAAGTLGERLTRFFLGIWENPVSRQPLLAVVRSAVANETAAAVFRRLVTVQLMRRVADELEGDDRELRVEMAAAQLVGVMMLRYVIRVEPMASADPEQVVAMAAPAVQRHLVPRRD